jgi:Uma2 family endonuclease
LFVSPAPNPEHDVVEKNILRQLFAYQEANPDIVGYVTDRARVFVASEEKTTAPEPDLAVYAEGPDDDWRTVGPFIVGEVLRGEDIDKDLFRNVELYWRVPSIQEYWVFDIRENPRRPTLLIHRRTRNGWDTRQLAASETYQTPLLPGLKLAISPNLWERRIAIIATFYFIKKGDPNPTFKIAEALLKDDHDLIHKAVGWMLREAGKRDVAVLTAFLDRHAHTMPRTTLRYAIERMLSDQRKHYLAYG